MLLLTLARMRQLARCWRPALNAAVLLVAVGLGLGVLWGIFSHDHAARPLASNPTPLPPREPAPPYENLQISRLAFSPDGEWVAVRQGVTVPQLVIRRTDDFSAVATVSDFIFDYPFVFSADSQRLLFTDLQSSGTLLAFDVAAGEFSVALPRLPALQHIAVAPDGQHIAVTARGRFIEVYELAQPRYPQRFAVRGRVQGLLFAPLTAVDAAPVLAVVMDDRVALWAAGAVLQESVFAARVGGAAFGADAALYVGLSSGAVLRLAEPGQPPQPLPLNRAGAVVGLDVHGERLAVQLRAGWGGRETVLVWRMAAGGRGLSLQHELALPLGGYGLRFAPDGTLYVLPRSVTDGHALTSPPLRLPVCKAARACAR